jgi:hypothetical protein
MTDTGIVGQGIVQVDVVERQGNARSLEGERDLTKVMECRSIVTATSRDPRTIAKAAH